ncbi:MAG: SH3 domain-containing protein [Clostridia bacterium]|nr:SH3 domain-containing protein [Clostridia bacterium]
MNTLKGILFCTLLAVCVLCVSGCFGTQEDTSSVNSVPTAPSADPTTTATQAPPTTPSTTGEPMVVQSIGYCTADSLNVRTGPGLDYRGIGGLRFAEQVEVLDKEGDWYKIRFGDGAAYVSAQYISAEKPSSQPVNNSTTLPPIGTDLVGTQTAPSTTTAH